MPAPAARAFYRSQGLGFSSNPSSPTYQRLLAAGVTKSQIQDAINSNINPNQAPPEYYHVPAGSYNPSPVGPGAPYSGGSSPGGSIPPPSDSYGGGSWPGYSPVGPYYPGSDPSGPAFSDPFQPGFTYTGPGSGGYSPTPTPPPSGGPTVEVPTTYGGAPPSYGSPSVPGTDIRDFGGDMTIGGNLPYVPQPGYNFYDAGNGITYVYDSDWNYLYTNEGPPAQTTQPNQPTAPTYNYNPGQPTFDPNQGFYGQPVTGAGPYMGGNMNPANPGYVTPRETTPGAFGSDPSAMAGGNATSWLGKLGPAARNL